MMRRIIAVVVVATMSLTSAPLFAAGAPRVARAAGLLQTGTLTGTAKSARGDNLPGYTVRGGVARATPREAHLGEASLRQESRRESE